MFWGVLCVGNPTFLGNPNCAFALLFDPGRIDASGHLRRANTAPALTTTKAPTMNFRGSITQLQHWLSTLRSAGRPATTQDSLPVAGQALPDGLHTRRVPVKGFKLTSCSLSSSSKLSWRKVRLSLYTLGLFGRRQFRFRMVVSNRLTADRVKSCLSGEHRGQALNTKSAGSRESRGCCSRFFPGCRRSMDIVTAAGSASISAAIASLQLSIASLWHESACGNPEARLAGPRTAFAAAGPAFGPAGKPSPGEPIFPGWHNSCSCRLLPDTIH